MILQINDSGIDRDHCAIENQNGVVRVIPRGDVRLNGKLISVPFALEHGAFVCFGRGSNFRYIDPQVVQRMKRTRLPNPEKPSLYSSAPALTTKPSGFALGMPNAQQKNVTSTSTDDPGYCCGSYSLRR